MPKKLQEYKNFWLIWLSSAGNPNGTSLFTIQKLWNITSNYLYHKESGLNKPLYSAMIEEGFITKKSRKITARFDWVPAYMIERHSPDKERWSLNIFMIENWAKIQDFIQKQHDILFGHENLKTLYRNIKTIRKTGQDIFEDIFTLVFVSNIMPFCAKYGANLVARIIYTMISMTPERDLLGYFKKIIPEISKMGDFPRIIENEKKLMDVLYSFEGKTTTK